MSRQARHQEEELRRMVAATPDNVSRTLARFDEIAARLDGHIPQGRSGIATRRPTARVSKRIANAGIAAGTILAATVAFGLIVEPIGIEGLFLVMAALLFALIFFGFWPTAREPKRVPFSDTLPTKAVVQQLDAILSRHRSTLPAPAARRVDAISQQLPLLESRLGEIDSLDPLAQDARRLMGRHLPDLLDRYERVPAEYRQERDGEGMTVDERLVTSLDAARVALDELGARLVQGDRDAFDTQGRFIESRYKDGGAGAA